MKRWSLQARLTTVVVSIVSGLLIIVSVLTVATLSSVLQNQLTKTVSDSSLRAHIWVMSAVQAGAPDAAAVLTWDATNVPTNKFLQPATLLILSLPSGLTGAYLDPDNRITVLDKTALKPATQATFAAGQTQDIAVPGVGTYRVVGQALGDGGVMLIGLPRSDVDTTIGLMIATISLLTLSALILLGVAIGVTMRTSLRPLRSIAATARRVSQLPLDQGRVDLRERVAADEADETTEIGQVGHALNTMLDHVDASLQARAANEERTRQFVADASHELRTPLASIRGYSELSLRDPAGPHTHVALERIQAQSVHMTRLVEDLLLLARLDEGQELVLTDVDLVPLTIEALADAQVADDSHDWAWSSDETEVIVRGDAGRLNQVITNLLANARTHTPAGTTVTVGLERDGDEAVVRVHDNGPGIEASVRNTLFERFARADRSRTRQTGGSGLGLSIAHAIALAHHGTLSVKSEPGNTVFELRLSSPQTRRS